MKRTISKTQLLAILAPIMAGVSIDFQEALRSLPDGAIFRIANEARPPAAYVFNQFLPEVGRPDYNAKNGTMIVRATMAGLVGMDSPYPPSGLVEVTTFDEETAKIANEVRFSEKMLRELQYFVQQVLNRGGNSIQTIVEEIFNFVDKVIVQGHLDVMEYLRGQALTTGKIDWTFNKKRLLVDYSIPSANIRAQDTGNNVWDGSTSKFWTAIQFIRKQLKHNLRAIVVHPDTRDRIIYNSVNSLAVTAMAPGGGFGPMTLRKVGSNGFFTQDVQDTVELYVYGDEGEIYDLANPGKTTKIPFMPRNALVGLGFDTGTRYVVGAGSTPPPELALGYTHIAPTIEGGGQVGRWADVFTPQEQPWQLVGRGVTNGLPVIESPDKVAIATSA